MTKMVDIGGKKEVRRSSRASGFIKLYGDTVEKIENNEIPKGDVLSVSQTAAILAVKDTPEIVPLTHPIPITKVNVDFELKENGVKAEVEVESKGQTGVEMEALTGVSAALLTIWDMVKGFEKDEDGQYPDTSIKNIRVLEKIKE